MRGCRVVGLNRLRDCYDTAQDLADVINRSRKYVLDRLNMKKEFTEREKRIIRLNLGDRYTDDLFI